MKKNQKQKSRDTVPLTKMLQTYSCTCSGMKLALETEVSVLVMEIRESRWWVVIVCDSSQ